VIKQLGVWGTELTVVCLNIGKKILRVIIRCWYALAAYDYI
jgi:hypothetical protein